MLGSRESSVRCWGGSKNATPELTQPLSGSRPPNIAAVQWIHNINIDPTCLMSMPALVLFSSLVLHTSWQCSSAEHLAARFNHHDALQHSTFDLSDSFGTRNMTGIFHPPPELRDPSEAHGDRTSSPGQTTGSRNPQSRSPCLNNPNSSGLNVGIFPSGPSMTRAVQSASAIP
jgi:hypothetical protein